MIKQKFSFKKNDESFFDGNYFIDRESARNTFLHFSTADDKEYNILMYYGIGGVGKSKLLVENQLAYKRLFPEAILFTVDLHDASKRSIDIVLKEFVENCPNKNINFDAFNLAYTLYFSKKHAGEKYDASRNLANNNFDLFFKILGIFDDGIVETVVEVIERIAKFARKKAIDSAVLKDLETFGSLSITEIEQHLPAYFQYDILRYVSAHPNTHLLFSIDTFEALNVQQTEEIHRRKNEEWIQNLIACFSSEVIPHSRFVIYGRDKLSWGDEWNTFIEQFELQDFSDDWTNKYLEYAGIKEQSIREIITSNSKGHPLCLYLSAKTYADITNKGRTPTKEDFGKSPQEIIQRFIYNLSDEEVNILKYLAVSNTFTYDIFKHILSNFHIACDPERFKHIVSYSFIHPLCANNYYIHPLMRKGLKECTDKESVAMVHEVLYDYYASIFTTQPNSDSFIELIYHAARTKTPSMFNNWLKESGSISHLTSFQIKGDQEFTFQITEDLIKQYGFHNLPLQLINIYIDALHLGGDYQAAVATSESYLKQYTLPQIISDEELCHMLIRKFHHSMFFLPADSLIVEVQQIYSNHYVDTYPNQLNEILFLLGGNLGVLSGRFDFSKEILSKALDYANKTNNNDSILRAIRKLADIETYEGKAINAIKLIEKHITPHATINNRYEIYLLASLGEAYRKSGDLTTARKCFDKVLLASRKKNISGWIAHAELALAMVDFELGNIAHALESATAAEKAYIHICQEWGIINSKTLILLANKKNGATTMDIDKKTDELIEHSIRMNYRYNTAILNELKATGDIHYFQLFFL